MGDHGLSTATLTPPTAPYNASLVFRDGLRRKLQRHQPRHTPGHRTVCLSLHHYIYSLYVVSKTVCVYLRHSAGPYSWLELTDPGQKEWQIRFRASHEKSSEGVLVHLDTMNMGIAA
jgi:hypothetical protein